jgi:hypothetical protein
LERSPFLAGIGEHMAVKDLSLRISLLIFFNSSSGVTIAKHTQKAYPCILHGKMECLQLLFTVHFSQHELTALFSVSYITVVIMIT